MKNPISEHVAKFILFAFPCYWTLAVIFFALAYWEAELNNPDLISVAWVSIAIIAAAILLMRKYYWISLPMIALGIYITLQEDQFVGHILRFYGVYLILHYSACGVYVFKNRQKRSG